MVKLPIRWQSLIWGILGFLIVLSGIASGNVVTIIVGAVIMDAIGKRRNYRSLMEGEGNI